MVSDLFYDEYEESDERPSDPWRGDPKLTAIVKLVRAGPTALPPDKEGTKKRLKEMFRDLKKQYPELSDIIKQNKVPAASVFSALLNNLSEELEKPERNQDEMLRIVLMIQMATSTVMHQWEEQKR